jgi:hypothetical protein
MPSDIFNAVTSASEVSGAISMKERIAGIFWYGEGNIVAVGL